MAFTLNKLSLSLSLIERQQQKREEQMEKLASGFKINRASDDAAGLQISNRLTSQINELDQLAVNSRDQINLNNVADARFSIITDNLQRANALSIQSGNPLYGGAVQDELDQITSEINVVAEQALGQSNFISGLDASDPAATQTAISDALTTISEQATSLGAQSNALSSKIGTYELTSINTSASRSRIRDTDFAKTISEQQKNEILLQATLIAKRNEEERKGLLFDKLV